MTTFEGIRIVSIGVLGALIGSSGLGIGGLLALLLRRFNVLFQSVVLCFSAGVVAALIIMEMIPESIQAGGLWLTLFGMGCGFWFASALHITADKVIIISPPLLADRTFQTALLMSIAISLHNIPAGASLGISFSQSLDFTYPLILVMIVHSIPEGFLVSLPLLTKRKYAAAYLLLITYVGMATGLGVIVGSLFNLEYGGLMGVILAIAVGTMTYVVWFEMIFPEIRKLQWTRGIIVLGMGATAGYLLTLLLV